jgi:hypothetical protein
MALVSRRISDISGQEGPENSFCQVVIRQHPKVESAKRLDALPDELADLKEVGDLVIVEVKFPDGASRELYVKYTDFVKLVSDEVINKAPGLRGRPPGYRPGNGN